MHKNQKLKEFLDKKDYEDALENEKRSPLTKWFVEILEKQFSALSNFDMIRCIRQNLFLHEIIDEIILRMEINETPFYSSEYSVELMEKLSSLDSIILNEYKQRLISIFENMSEKDLINKSEIWLYDEEKDEYKGYVNKLLSKLQ